MSNRKPRVTNGQRAAVCGLMIAGLNFTDACLVADVSQFQVKEFLPPGWIKRPPAKRTNRCWKGTRLEEVRLAYLDRSLQGREIARRFGMDVNYLYRLAQRNDWPRRERSQHEKPVLNLTPEQRRAFKKLRRYGIDLNEALSVAMRP